jgi:hypothetical protein
MNPQKRAFRVGDKIRWTQSSSWSGFAPSWVTGIIESIEAETMRVRQLDGAYPDRVWDSTGWEDIAELVEKTRPKHRLVDVGSHYELQEV